jgi:hypothetical protein
MAVESVLYLVLMVVIEKMSYTFKVPPNERIATKIQDEKVLQEIERANEVIEGRQIEIESETPNNMVDPTKNTNNNGHGANSTQEHNVVSTNMPQGSTEKLEYQPDVNVNNKLVEQDDKKGSSLSRGKLNENEKTEEATKKLTLEEIIDQKKKGINEELDSDLDNEDIFFDEDDIDDDFKI